MLVPVVLIGTAKLQQVVTFQVGNVVAHHLVVPIPITGAGILGVYVVRTEIASLAQLLAAHNLERSAQASHLRRIPLADPLPEVTQETVVEVIGGVRGDVGGQARCPHLWLGRILGQGSRHALRVAGEKAADVNLVSRSRSQFEEMIGRVEMPLGRKIVIEPRSYEFAGLRIRQYCPRTPAHSCRRKAADSRLHSTAARTCSISVRPTGLSPMPKRINALPARWKLVRHGVN